MLAGFIYGCAHAPAAIPPEVDHLTRVPSPAESQAEYDAMKASGRRPPFRFDRGAVRIALGEAKKQLPACANALDAPGEGHAKITFASDGRVSDVTLDRWPFDVSLSRVCIETVFYRATIPELSGSPVTVQTSFELSHPCTRSCTARIVYRLAMQTWQARPSEAEVVRHAREFFATLVAGKLEDAEGMVAHAFEDWNENVYNLFQDHYLIHETPPDSTFEGNWWKTNRAWLADFSIAGDGQWMGKQRNVLWLDLAYRGEPSGYIAELQLEERDGKFVLQHNAFRMA